MNWPMRATMVINSGAGPFKDKTPFPQIVVGTDHMFVDEARSLVVQLQVAIHAADEFSRHIKDRADEAARIEREKNKPAAAEKP